MASADAGYIVFALPGRRRVEVQHADWFDGRVQAGSIAKLATLRGALEQGVIAPDTRIACTRRVTLADGRRADCSHPALAGPIAAADAIAHSCNAFVAAVAPRLSRAQLSAAFVAAGLPPLTADEDPLAAAIGLGGARVPADRLLDVLVRAIDGPAAIREGVSRAADRGTASAFGDAGVPAFAKTGTARMPTGRSLGLAVAVAPRAQPTHGVVVLVPGASGADAASIGATLLASFTRPRSERLRLGRARADGGYDVTAVDLEDYVAEVVTGETGAATPTAAREALATTARTFALANRQRHRAEGFDLCSLTHCQVARPADTSARQVAAATRERVLRLDGRPAPVFYSAECGGMLDAASALAGSAPAWRNVAWARARPDPAGVEEPEWRTVVAASTLDGALRRAGLRGDAVADLSVEANSAGRVRRVRVRGMRPETMRVDDFRRLVGHDIGWHIVRSTRFTIRRVAEGYELRGRGHGHGVGLCVFGASHLARAGRTADEILAAYFPGLTVAAAVAADRTPAIRLHLPAVSEDRRRDVLGVVNRALDSLGTTIGETPPTPIDIVVHPTVESYQRATARPWWTSAAARAEEGRWTIDTIPLDSLERAGRLESTLRHELAHVLIDARLTGRPLWVREGLAMHFAGERPPPLEGRCPADDEIRRPASREAMASSYRRAASCVARALAAGVGWRDINP